MNARTRSLVAALGLALLGCSSSSSSSADPPLPTECATDADCMACAAPQCGCAATSAACAPQREACFVDPCRAHRAVCRASRCVLERVPEPAPSEEVEPAPPAET